jgi:Flp pilus assembly protein TadG
MRRGIPFGRFRLAIAGQAWRSIRRDRSGVAAVEAALILGFFLVPAMLVGTDLMLAFLADRKLEQSVSAVSQMVAVNPDLAANGTTDDIKTVFLTISDLEESDVELSATRECTCQVLAGSERTLVSTNVSCNAQCTSPARKQRYLTIDVARSVNFLFDYPIVGEDMTLASRMHVRIDE